MSKPTARAVRLSALIRRARPCPTTVARGSEPAATISVEAIRPNPRQPRKDFDDAAITQLANSIRTKGVLQPVIVRPAPDGGYELVAGERRLRAAKLAGLTQVPAIVRDVSDADSVEMRSSKTPTRRPQPTRAGRPLTASTRYVQEHVEQLAAPARAGRISRTTSAFWTWPSRCASCSPPVS